MPEEMPELIRSASFFDMFLVYRYVSQIQLGVQYGNLDNEAEEVNIFLCRQLSSLGRFLSRILLLNASVTINNPDSVSMYQKSWSRTQLGCCPSCFQAVLVSEDLWKFWAYVG